ncbi:MmgE/PrpD family protein [Caballeronia calidae]|uniref:MmgE/PrpD family protein n=1 Tax=Caballeronia calidae TaxID=1777139 RepID=A0A158ED46_9BURK|nr:MmgE/PrpD family protein [Caballeronia calidae]SAL04768.1 MmgE/PrpD family protein [Caballeronia calidae]
MEPQQLVTDDSSQGTDVTRALCGFLASLRFDDIPRATIERAKDLLLDHVAVALLGTRECATRAVRDTIAAWGGRPESSIYGSTQLVPRAHAAFINAAAAYSVSLDDMHNESLSHPGSVVIPAAMSVAEALNATPRQFLTALVAGYEAQGRIGAAARNAIARGFHPTGVAGTFGSGAAAAHVMQLDSAGFESTFGIALSTASGSMQFSSDGESTVKRLHAGLPAQGGLTAALLASAGLRGPKAALHGQYGVITLFGGAGDATRLTRGMGETWEIDQINFKLHACCRWFHSSIDALLACRKQRSFAPTDVERVLVRAPAAALENHMQYRPKSTPSAQYSLPYAMAAALLLDTKDPGAFAEQHLADPAVLALMDRVEAESDPSLDRWLPDRFPGLVRVHLKNGELIEEFRQDSVGTPDFPVHRADIESKFHALVSGIATQEWRDRIADAIFRLEDGPSISGLTSLLRNLPAS